MTQETNTNPVLPHVLVNRHKSQILFLPKVLGQNQEIMKAPESQRI